MKKLKLIAGFLVAPLFVWGAYHQIPELRQEAQLTSAPGITPGRKQEASSLLYSVKTGVRYVYSFERHLQIHGMAESPEISFQGNFYLDSLGTNSANWDFLLHADLSTGVGFPEEKLRAAIGSTSATIKVYKNSENPFVDPQQRNLLRDLLSLWLFPLSEDSTSKYTAKFSQLSENQWSKVKLKYALASAPLIRRSDHLLTLDETERVPAEISGTEETQMGEGTQTLSSKSSYKLRLVRIEPLLVHADVRKWGDPETFSLEISTPLKMTAAQIAALWKQSLQTLEHWNQLTNSERLQLFGELEKILRADPSYGTKLVGLLSAGELQAGKSDLFKLVVGDLATVGGEEGERALEEIYRQTSPQGQGTILAAQASTEATLGSHEAIFLTQEMRTQEGNDLGWGAAFAYGSMLRGKNSTSSELNVVFEGFEKAKRSRDLEALMDWMDVMGNAGKAEFAPALIQQISTAALDSVKAKALFSLRFIDQEDARATLAKNLTSSTEAAREAAARAIQIAAWNASFVPALMDCKVNEVKPSIQEICSSTLAQHAEQISYNGN